MKRFLMPATALAALKKVTLAILCGAVLMIVAAPAWADQCSAPTVGVGTGAVGSANGSNTCGAVIVVFGVDGLGSANSFVVLAAGNGNPYDTVEDTLVGVQNNSGAILNSIPLSGTDIFGFDGDGPCTFNSYSWCTTIGFSGYEGPDNTFSHDGSNSGTVSFTTGIPNNGSTWFALEGTPQSISGTTVQLPLSTGVTTLQFFGNTIQTLDYTNSGNTSFNGFTVQATFLPISDSAYQNLVAGTFAQGSKCMPQDITGTGTTFTCAGVVVLCEGPTDTTFTGQHCPQAGAGFIGVKEKYLTNAFPANGSAQVPSPGYLALTDNALSCTNDTDNSCRKLNNIFGAITEDCCATSGPVKQFNSFFVPNYCLDNVSSVDRLNVVGFAPPVDNPGSGITPVVNNINSKQAVPLKLTVGCPGSPVNNLDLVGSTNPATVHSVVLSVTTALAGICNNNVVDNNLTTIASAGNSGWQILGGGAYQFNWKPSAPVGSCLLFSINLGDGVPHSAYFQITK